MIFQALGRCHHRLSNLIIRILKLLSNHVRIIQVRLDALEHIVRTRALTPHVAVAWIERQYWANRSLTAKVLLLMIWKAWHLNLTLYLITTLFDSRYCFINWSLHGALPLMQEHGVPRLLVRAQIPEIEVVHLVESRVSTLVALVDGRGLSNHFLLLQRKLLIFFDAAVVALLYVLVQLIVIFADCHIVELVGIATHAWHFPQRFGAIVQVLIPGSRDREHRRPRCITRFWTISGFNWPRSLAHRPHLTDLVAIVDHWVQVEIEYLSREGMGCYTMLKVIQGFRTLLVAVIEEPISSSNRRFPWIYLNTARPVSSQLVTHDRWSVSWPLIWLVIVIVIADVSIINHLCFVLRVLLVFGLRYRIRAIVVLIKLPNRLRLRYTHVPFFGPIGAIEKSLSSFRWDWEE